MLINHLVILPPITMMSNEFTKRKVIILLGTHHGDVFLRVVVVADQVQQAMNDYPVQLVGEFRPVEGRVLTNRINADEQVAVQAVSFAVVESDDVREVIMLEILHVHIQDVVVRTENNGDIPQAADLALGHQLQPAARQSLFLENEASIFRKISDHTG